MVIIELPTAEKKVASIYYDPRIIVHIFNEMLAVHYEGNAFVLMQTRN